MLAALVGLAIYEARLHEYEALVPGGVWCSQDSSFVLRSIWAQHLLTVTFRFVLRARGRVSLAPDGPRFRWPIIDS